jgi:hypothetical protein
MVATRGHASTWESPSSVAFIIREYVSPPPVFYLQEGDLILEVEESESPEWYKLLVFRKYCGHDVSKRWTMGGAYIFDCRACHHGCYC